MKRIFQKAHRLSRLRALIERGIFAVPQLQREFVWTARKACDLVDSIYRNLPIGTILVWKTDRKNEGQLRKTFHILPAFNHSNGDVYFLIDGQQRLSVLWHFLRGEGHSVTNSDGKVVDFGKIYFDTGTTEDERRFVYRSRLVGELEKRSVPIVDILSPRWRQRVRGRGARDLARIADCRVRILRYAALFVFCETNEITEVREAFIRINSLGMRIGSADRAFARASSFDLRNDVRDALFRLSHGFKWLQRETILQTLSFALGGNDLGERAIDAMITRLERDVTAKADFDRSWPVLREAFSVAADYFVHELGVPNRDFLPSEPMMTALALYFFHRRNARPPVAAKRSIRRWFWATAVGARYSGRGYRPNLIADAEFMKRLAAKPGARQRIAVAVPSYTLKGIDYGRPGPVSNAFFILLRRQRPRYLEDGVEIPAGDISSRANRSDKHHVFPRALLSRYGIGPERYNSILNVCYLVARENQQIGQKAPRHYLNTIPLSQSAQARAMRSHLIPNKATTGVWSRSIRGGFKQFLEQRTRLLIKAFEQEAGMRLFERL